MKIYMLWCVILLPMICSAQLEADFKKDSLAIKSMSDYILDNHVCYDDLRVLCKTVGHRISGSPAAAKAVIWGKKALQEAGCDYVYLQPVKVPHWIRGEEQFKVILNSGKEIKFNQALGLGNAVGTEGLNLNAPIIEVTDLKELESLGVENINGKIVFFNHAWNQKIVSPFDEYGGCVFYRWAGPSEAAKFGAVGCIIRSAGSAKDNYAHTGSMRYDEKYNKIPAMAISYMEADALQKLCRTNQIKSATINSNSHFGADVPSYNVIGEIKGSDFADEIITIGGHLDSWDVGEGAHDDGAGCVQSIEVMRALKRTGASPRRTVRCVLFMNEENGLRGGLEYARVAAEKKENHICAIETDAGGNSPRGFDLKMKPSQRAKVKSWNKIFFPYGVYNFEEEGGGADINPLQKELGTPLMGLMPDPQRYFDLHHTHNDVFEQVHRRELCLGAVAMSAMVYMLSEYGL
jgi:carboxypeptidase Q